MASGVWKKGQKSSPERLAELKKYWTEIEAQEAKARIQDPKKAGSADAAGRPGETDEQRLKRLRMRTGSATGNKGIIGSMLNLGSSQLLGGGRAG